MNNTNISTNATRVTDPGEITAYTLLPVHFALSTFICTVNVLTVIVFVRTPSLRIIPNLYVISLTVADLLTGVYIPAISVPLLYTRSSVFCFLSFAAFILLSCQSFLTTMLIGADRFIYIIYPFRYDVVVSRVSTLVLIVTSWVVSTAVSGLAYPTSNWTGDCRNIAMMSAPYLNGVITFYVVLVTATGILYALISRAAFRQRMKIRSLDVSGQTAARRNRYKHVTLFLLIYGLIVTCWIPSILVFFIKYFTGRHSVVSQRVVMTVAFLNSGMNFFVYIWKNKEFRKAFKMIFCRRDGDVEPAESLTRSANIVRSRES